VKRICWRFLFIILFIPFISCGGNYSSSNQDIDNLAKSLKKSELPYFSLIKLKSLIKGTSDRDSGGRLFINNARLSLAISLIKEGKSLDEAIVQSQEELERKSEMDYIKGASPERRRFDGLTDRL